MSRSVSRRGRMRSEDQLRMQINAEFIEYEVDGQDLVTSLFTYQTIDLDDKEEIMSKSTQVERIRRLVDILLFRGPKAFEDFLRCLDSNGYEHVSFRLRNTIPEKVRESIDETDEASGDGAIQVVENSCTCEVQKNASSSQNTDVDKSIPDNVFLTSSGESSDLGKQLVCVGGLNGIGGNGSDESSDDDSDAPPMSDRVKAVEDSIYILSRRLTRAENRAMASAKLPEEELHILKVELTLLKTDTLQQICDLTAENERKDLMIEHLSKEVDEKKTKLERAQSKIDLLERRIATLETEKNRAEADLRLVKQRLDDNEKQLEDQNTHFSAESLRMRNQMLLQQKKSKEQEAALVELQKKDMENNQRFTEQQEQILAAQDELREQQLNMAEQQQRINALANVIQGIAQSGISAPGSNPMMCISGNSVSSTNDKVSGMRTTGKRWTNTTHHKCSKRK